MQSKTFNHELVEKFTLNRETINGQRYYVLPDGVCKLKSVTTILSEVLDKSALERWKERVGEAEAQRISAFAARRGTAVHAIAERYVLNDPQYKKGSMPGDISSFIPIREVLNEHVDDIMGIELPLYSKALGCAGTTDLVAKFNGINSIIDFKTSTRIKDESWIEGYFLQSTVYSMMFEMLYKVSIPQIVLIITVDDEPNAQVIVKDRAQFVNRVIEVFSQGR